MPRLMDSKALFGEFTAVLLLIINNIVACPIHNRLCTSQSVIELGTLRKYYGCLDF